MRRLSLKSTDFGVDPINIRKKTNREFYGWFKLKTERMRFELTVGV